MAVLTGDDWATVRAKVLDTAFEGPATDEEEAAVKPAIVEFVKECERYNKFPSCVNKLSPHVAM